MEFYLGFKHSFAKLRPQAFWDFNTYFSLLAIGINLATGTAMLIAHKNVLINQDELQQKIALEAMALSLGVGAVLGMCYEAFEDMQLIQYEPEIPHLVMVMCVTYMAGHLRGHWKYR